MSAPLIEVRGLGKAFSTHRFVLRHIDLSVQAGERVALFGPNGAGKTTLLKLLAGLARPTEGQVEVYGLPPWGTGKAATIRQRLGVLSHQTYLYEELTPVENLRLFARLYGVRDVEARVEEALGSVGMLEARGRVVGTLSRGMQQRVALARATLHDPRVLLLDEPETGLDEAARKTLEDLLISEMGAERTVLLATHNVELGTRVMERWIVLDGGRIVQDVRKGEMDGAEFRELYRRIAGGDGRPAAA